MARFYRAELNAHAPEACAILDQSAKDFGEGWVVPQLMTVDLDREVTVEHAAELVGRTPAAIHKWINRDQRLTARRDDKGRWLVVVRDVLDVNADLRRKRAGQVEKKAS